MMHGHDWDALGRLSEAERRDGPIPEDELILIRYGSFAACACDARSATTDATTTWIP